LHSLEWLKLEIELACIIILHFRVSFDPVKNLLFTIPFKSDILRSTPQWIQRVHECPCHILSFVFECSHKHNDRQANIRLRFCDIMDMNNLLVSVFYFVKNRLFSEESANRYWDTKFSATCQKDSEW
jgi:hypothetical protein